MAGAWRRSARLPRNRYGRRPAGGSGSAARRHPGSRRDPRHSTRGRQEFRGRLEVMLRDRRPAPGRALLERRVATPISRLGVNGDPTREVEHWNYLHAGYPLRRYMKLPRAILGWDIGGVNIKAALLECNPEAVAVRSSCTPFQMQRDAPDLAPTLCRVVEALDAGGAESHAVTMTAELSQAFRTKREGVAFVLDALARAFPAAAIQVYTVKGRFVDQTEARLIPLEVGASNWAATASFVAPASSYLYSPGHWNHVLRYHPDREWTGRSRRIHRPRAPRQRGAGLHRSTADPGGSGDIRVAVVGAKRRISADGFAIIGDAHSVVRPTWRRRLHLPDSRRPSRYTRICWGTAGPNGLRRSRDAGRRRQSTLSPTLWRRLSDRASWTSAAKDQNEVAHYHRGRRHRIWATSSLPMSLVPQGSALLP